MTAEVFFVMAAIYKRRNSLPSSIFELQQIKKFRLTLALGTSGFLIAG